MRRFAIVQTGAGPAAAWLQERSPRRVEALLADGARAVLPAARVLLSWEEPGAAPGDEPSAAAEKVAALATELHDPPPGFDPEALSGSMPPGEAVPFAVLAARVLSEGAGGRLQGRLYWALANSEDRFRRVREGFVARTPAEREQRARREAELQAHQAWLVQVSGWIAGLEAGTPVPEDGTSNPPLSEFIGQLRSLAAFEARSPHWKALRQPLGLVAQDWPGNRERLGRWLEAAGAWTGWPALWLEGAGVPRGFAPGLLAAADALLARPLDSAGRQDHRGVVAYSLDAAHTRDVDDAVSILAREGETLEIAVHIADPAAFLAPGDPLFEEALRRAATVYTEDGVFPMLPEAISTGRFSLAAGEAREALSFRLRLTPEGPELLAIEPSVVRIEANLDYAQGAALLEPGQSDWACLARRCEGLVAARAAAGAHIVERPEIVVDTRDPARIRLTRIDRHGPVHRLVEELAILVNTEAGRYFSRQRLPAFYRVQPQKNDGSGGQVPPARFSLAGAPHEGLASERYVQVTSPIRRITDLAMVRQLTAHLREGRAAFPDAALLEGWMKQAERRFTVYHQLERRIEDHWKRRYLAQNPALEVTGIVRLDARGRPRIWLDELLMNAEGDLPGGMEPRSRGRFRIAAVDLHRERVQLELVEPL